MAGWHFVSKGVLHFTFKTYTSNARIISFIVNNKTVKPGSTIEVEPNKPVNIYVNVQNLDGFKDAMLKIGCKVYVNNKLVGKGETKPFVLKPRYIAKVGPFVLRTSQACSMEFDLYAYY